MDRVNPWFFFYKKQTDFHDQQLYVQSPVCDVSNKCQCLIMHGSNQSARSADFSIPLLTIVL